MVAFLGSTAIFACFTGAALLAKRREYLFWGGVLSSAVSMLLLMQFGSMFWGGGRFLFNLEVHLIDLAHNFLSAYLIGLSLYWYSKIKIPEVKKIMWERAECVHQVSSVQKLLFGGTNDICTINNFPIFYLTFYYIQDLLFHKYLLYFDDVLKF